MNYIGDFAEDETVYLSFNTFTSDDPSASCTITNFINTDIHVHRDSGLTQRNNAAGVVVSVDFDGITGNHIVAIDTSDNTVADFWITGHDYFVRAEGTTIDGATVNAFIAHFSIENRFMRGTDSAATSAALSTHDGKLDTVDTVVDGIQTDLSNAADGLGALKTLIEANPTVGEIRTEMEGAGTKLLAIEGYTDKIDDATNGLTAIKAEVEGLAGAAMRGTDGANTTVPDAAGVAPTADEIRTEMEGAGSKILAIEGDTNELQTNQGAWATATGFSTHDAADVKTAVEQAGSSIAQILGDTGELQTNQGNWLTATGFSTHNAAAVWSVAARVLTANTNFNDLTAAEMKAEVVAALADIKLDHLLNIAVDTDWETTVHLNSVIGHMTDVGTAATFNRTTDALEAIRNRGDAAWITATGFNTTTPPTVGEIRTEMEGVGSKILAIEGDTNELQTNQGNWATAVGFSTHAAADVKTSVEQAGSSLAQILEDTGTTLPAAIAAVGGYLLEAEIATVTDQTHITLATGSDVDDAYKDQTIVLYDDTNSDFPSVRKIIAYTGTTKAVTLDSAADFTVGTDDSVKIFVTAPGTTAPTAVENAIAVWDRILTGATHNIATSAGRRVREIGAYAIHGDTAQGGNGMSITLAAGASATDGVYNRNLIAIVGGTGTGQTRQIADYVGASRIVTVDRDWRVSPDATSEYQITASNVFALVDQGRAQGGTSTTITLRDYASDVDDIYVCNQIGIIAGPGRGSVRLCGSYDGATKVATICGEDWAQNPTVDSIYVMLPYGTSCSSCVGDYALSQIKGKCDDALSDVNLHKHDQNMKAIIRSEY